MLAEQALRCLIVVRPTSVDVSTVQAQGNKHKPTPGQNPEVHSPPQFLLFVRSPRRARVKSMSALVSCLFVYTAPVLRNFWIREDVVTVASVFARGDLLIVR